jgi:hypothetical protein
MATAKVSKRFRRQAIAADRAPNGHADRNAGGEEALQIARV